MYLIASTFSLFPPRLFSSPISSDNNETFLRLFRRSVAQMSTIVQRTTPLSVFVGRVLPDV